MKAEELVEVALLEIMEEHSIIIISITENGGGNGWQSSQTKRLFLQTRGGGMYIHQVLTRYDRIVINHLVIINQHFLRDHSKQWI